jgi:hypothetical protein
LTCGGLHSGVSQKLEILKALLVSAMRVADVAVLVIITQTISRTDYELRISSLFSNPLYYVYFVERIVFSNTLNVIRHDFFLQNVISSFKPKKPERWGGGGGASKANVLT